MPHCITNPGTYRKWGNVMYVLVKSLIVAVAGFMFGLIYPESVAGFLLIEFFVLRMIGRLEELRLIESQEGDASRAYILIAGVVAVGSGITWRTDFYPEIATVVNWAFLPILFFVFLLLRPSIRVELKKSK